MEALDLYIPDGDHRQAALYWIRDNTRTRIKNVAVMTRGNKVTLVGLDDEGNALFNVAPLSESGRLLLQALKQLTIVKSGGTLPLEDDPNIKTVII